MNQRDVGVFNRLPQLPVNSYFIFIFLTGLFVKIFCNNKKEEKKNSCQDLFTSFMKERLVMVE